MTDDGAADPRLAAALAGDSGSAAGRAEVLAALAGARVFVAITATSTAEETASATGLRAESSAEMALVSVLASDGERAVPAFPDTSTLRRWRLDVRPVPVSGAYLARAALDDGASAVLLDPQGGAVVVRRDDLAALAAGYVPVTGSSLAVQRTGAALTEPLDPPAPAWVAALSQALRPERLRAARLLDGPHGPVLGIAPRRSLDAASLASLAERVRERLGPLLPDSGLDLAVVPTRGPGHPVLTRRGR